MAAVFEKLPMIMIRWSARYSTPKSNATSDGPASVVNLGTELCAEETRDKKMENERFSWFWLAH